MSGDGDSSIISLDVLLELIVFVIIAGVMFLWLSQLDVSFVQKTYLVQNFGMIAGLASFFPGSIDYEYLTYEDDSLMNFFKANPDLTLTTGEVFLYSDRGEELKDEYGVFLLDPLDVTTKDLEKGAFRLSKRGDSLLSYGDPLHQQIFCEPSPYSFTYHSAYGGESSFLYRDGEVLGSINSSKKVYEGFDLHYLIDSKEGYPANLGEGNHGEIIREMLFLSGVNFEEDYFALEELSSTDLVVSFDLEYDGRYVVGYYTNNETKGQVCAIVTSLLLSGVFEGGNIIPTSDSYSSISFSYGDDLTYYTKDRIIQLANAFSEGEWE